MRLLLDANVHADLIDLLETDGHDVASVARLIQSSADDETVLALAVAEDRILITHDRDFGDLIFRHGRPHRGVLYLRLGSTVPDHLHSRIVHALVSNSFREGEFLVVTDTAVRRARNTP